MKKLTNMLAVAVAVSAMQTAKAAEGGEHDFAFGGEIKQISIVNGQLEVRSEGAQVQGVKTPYAYVGTNTEHFAESAFAKGGLDTVDTYVHTGAGKIAITKGKDSYVTQIRQAPAPLNGVTDIKLVSSADDPSLAQTKAKMNEIKAKYPKDNVKMFGSDIYKIVPNSEGTGMSVGKFAGMDASGTNEMWNVSSMAGTSSKVISDYVVVKDGIDDWTYALAEGNVYNNRSSLVVPATTIALAGDQQTVIVKKGGKETLINGKKGAQIDVANGATTLEANELAALEQKANASGTIVSAVKVGDVTYYATAQKLGWYRERN